jgi:hypothetical protein
MGGVARAVAVGAGALSVVSEVDEGGGIMGDAEGDGDSKGCGEGGMTGVECAAGVAERGGAGGRMTMESSTVAGMAVVAIVRKVLVWKGKLFSLKVTWREVITHYYRIGLWSLAQNEQ